MTILLHGSDSFRITQRLKRLKEGFKQKYDQTGLNISVFEGESLKLEDFRRAISSQSFLAKRRMVVVKNLLKNKNKKLWEDLSQYLTAKKIPEKNILIFVEEKNSEDNQKKNRNKDWNSFLFFKKLSKVKTERYDFLEGYQLDKWIKEEVEKRGGKIAIEAIKQLADLVGSDLWQMTGEIEKLINYKKGKLIAREDVNLFVRTKFDENIFHLTDALGTKNQRLALKLINEQLASGLHELTLLSKLIWQFRILLQVKDFLESRGEAYRLASSLGVHPFVAQKASGQVKSFTLDELKAIYQKLLSIDTKIKTGQLEPKVLFNLLVVEVCG